MTAIAGHRSKAHGLPPPDQPGFSAAASPRRRLRAAALRRMSAGAAVELPFQWIVEQSLAAIYVIQDDVYTYVNPTFLAMLGRSAGEVIGRGPEAIARPDEAARIRENVRRRIDGEILKLRYVVELLHRDGRTVSMEVDGARVEVGGRPAVVGIGLDVSERLGHQRELEHSRQRLQELTAYINTLREAQRAKFARELHDELGGMLSSLKMDIGRLTRRTRSPAMLGVLGEMDGVAREAIDIVRRVADDLRPAVLDHLGLLAAIRGRLEQFQRRYGVKCILEPEELELPLPQSHANNIYRICQEALTNVGRHARARTLSVHLAWDGAVFVLTIDDDGVGFAATVPRPGAMGLLGMGERARELGGTLEFLPRRPRGTRLVLRVPLAAP